MSQILGRCRDWEAGCKAERASPLNGGGVAGVVFLVAVVALRKLRRAQELSSCLVFKKKKNQFMPMHWALMSQKYGVIIYRTLPLGGAHVLEGRAENLSSRCYFVSAALSLMCDLPRLLSATPNVSPSSKNRKFWSIFFKVALSAN